MMTCFPQKKKEEEHERLQLSSCRKKGEGGRGEGRTLQSEDFASVPHLGNTEKRLSRC